MNKAPRKPVLAPVPSPAVENASARSTGFRPQDCDPATPAPFDATDERFIDFLVDEALKTWRARIS